MAARRARKWIGWIIVIVIVIAVLKILFIYSGIYNVAANYPDKAPVAWVLSNVMDHSVKRHAASIKTPNLDDPAMILRGLGHYRMCAGCHGAPGIHQGKIAKGMNPAPPELTEAAADWKPNELFWITKNGIRMTGMPAFGDALSDKEIWDIAAFAQKLPKLTPSEYKAMSSKLPPMKHPQD
jgi:mono/diheme cytochrome c family protein